jgi:hypothetical protein
MFGLLARNHAYRHMEIISMKCSNPPIAFAGRTGRAVFSFVMAVDENYYGSWRHGAQTAAAGVSMETYPVSQV